FLVVFCASIVVSFTCFFFFFQAEDGIRDATVTGVQSVLFRSCSRAFRVPAHAVAIVGSCLEVRRQLANERMGTYRAFVNVLLVRSEERRVGKEFRSGW